VVLCADRLTRAPAARCIHELLHCRRRFPIADHFTTLALMNKQDYAQLHGLEVHLSAQNVDDKATVRVAVKHEANPTLSARMSSLFLGYVACDGFHTNARRQHCTADDHAEAGHGSPTSFDAVCRAITTSWRGSGGC